jgi:hypothetical protein
VTSGGISRACSRRAGSSESGPRLRRDAGGVQVPEPAGHLEKGRGWFTTETFSELEVFEFP